MRNLFTAGAVVVTIISGTAADLCSSGSQLINGNWYCQPVQRVRYHGVGGHGVYNRVTGMDSATGTCTSTPVEYEGSLAPFDEGMSLHLRGPLRIKQVAVYTPGASSTEPSKKARRSPHERRHGHQHFHTHNKDIREIQERAEAEKRAVGDIVTATINGQVVSWVNEYDGTNPTPNPNPVNNAPPAAPTGGSPAPRPSSRSGSASAPSNSGDWSRIAYYNAEQGEAYGLTFLGNYGGDQSGVFDYTFGLSLSYVDSTGTRGGASPQILEDILLPSNKEITIMSDRECTDGSCGYTRPGAVAYHGFEGTEKAFFFEFSMPDDGTSGWNMNMPAIWGLSAQIPVTTQYGQAECSCWTSGCGEVDFFEVLDSGNNRCKSTIHGNISGGSSDFFERPTGAPIKAAVVFKDDAISIQVLDDNVGFDNFMSAPTVEDICQDDTPDLLTSLFAMAG